MKIWSKISNSERSSYLPIWLGEEGSPVIIVDYGVREKVETLSVV